MSDLILHRAPGSEVSHAIALPKPRLRNGGGEIAVREAVLDDLPFIDQLQKMHTKMVGFFPRMWFENNIKAGKVLIAEDAVGRTPVGYCIAQDKYLKREELGIVYQLNVLPMKQRGLIGATLLKEVFHRAAYGCKLFCCWCAQDLEANHFWQSMGFLPLAFRTGSRKAGQKKEPRIHIFWQRRIREGDVETPYWFPSETSGGAVREARLVLPIPPGTHWSDAKPAVLPGMEQVNVLPPAPEGEKKSRSSRKKREAKPAAAPEPSAGVHASGMWFAPAAPPPPTPEEIARAKEEKKKEKAARPRMKNDPKLIAAARELRDRYTEQFNAAPGMLPPSGYGKYDVSRQLADAPSVMKKDGQPGLLDAA